MELTIKTTISEERTVNIETPIFWKEPQSKNSKITDYLGVIDTDNCIGFYNSGSGYVSLTHCKAEIKGNDIRKASLIWERISEEEFLTAHKNMLNSLSLEPQLTNVDDLKDVNL